MGRVGQLVVNVQIRKANGLDNSCLCNLQPLKLASNWLASHPESLVSLAIVRLVAMTSFGATESGLKSPSMSALR
jgi:hypothetical protein